MALAAAARGKRPALCLLHLRPSQIMEPMLHLALGR